MEKYPKLNVPKSLFKRIKIALGLAIGTFTNINLTKVLQYPSSDASISQAPSLTAQKPHPLPSTLARSQNDNNSGDYFSEIKPTKYGYLIWSQFPVKVYLEPPNISNSVQSQ